jgi:hypothetical protein
MLGHLRPGEPEQRADNERRERVATEHQRHDTQADGHQELALVEAGRREQRGGSAVTRAARPGW